MLFGLGEQQVGAQRLGLGVAILVCGVEKHLGVVVAIEKLQLHDLLGEVGIPRHRSQFTEILQRQLMSALTVGGFTSGMQCQGECITVA